MNDIRDLLISHFPFTSYELNFIIELASRDTYFYNMILDWSKSLSNDEAVDIQNYVHEQIRLDVICDNLIWE